MNLNIPAIDLEAESQGKWFYYLGGIELKIARINNSDYLAAAVQRYEELGEDSASTKDKEELMGELYAEFILKDWRGVKDQDEEISYTPEVGKAILIDPRYRDMLAFLVTKAKDITQYWEKKTVETGEE